MMVDKLEPKTQNPGERTTGKNLATKNTWF